MAEFESENQSNEQGVLHTEIPATSNSAQPEPHSLFEAEPLEAANAAQRHSIAPWWHTAVLIAGILLLSLTGTKRLGITGGLAPHRMFTYGMTIAMQLTMLGWVWLGLKLSKVPFRSLYGVSRRGAKAWFIDIGIALLFWWVSLFVLGSLNLGWLTVDAAVHHRPLPMHAGKMSEVDPAQRHQVRLISQLAPESGAEFAMWFVLCAVVGVVEETVFRGYLQSQFTAWGRGKAAYGVVFSALMFGAAHGYEGYRSMVLLAVFGVLFSMLVLLRRSLRSCIYAHAWHDFVTGITLALLRSHHVL
ncbi:MAG TPA: type II CAAX endopeptidase family protein [Terracidiphilus sp.]|nr:type II CAAX endopeptidase family protein [Terracidiphilus sp.]